VREVAQALWERLLPSVEQAGYDLEDLVVTSAGRRRLVRVVVDKDGGVTLDECAELSRVVSAQLDTADSLVGDVPYTLEVSSPGVSRPLREPRHWRRAAGRTVKVVRPDGSTLLGRVVDSDETGARVRAADGEVTVAYADVAKATVQVDMSRDR
jgi:ribosome maturation factor RimP